MCSCDYLFTVYDAVLISPDQEYLAFKLLQGHYTIKGSVCQDTLDNVFENPNSFLLLPIRSITLDGNAELVTWLVLRNTTTQRGGKGRG